MAVNERTVLIGGEAGQGLVTVGDLLARSLVRAGYHIVVTQDYLSRIRGGHNTFALRVSDEEIAAPSETVDLLLALDAETAVRHRDSLATGGVIVADQAFDLPGDGYLKVPYQELAEGRFANVAALGVAGALLGLDQEVLVLGLEKAFGKKHPDLLEKNRAALARAYAWCAGQQPHPVKLPPVAVHPRRLTLNGNEAVALGAMAAGVKFCSFYPMTPATSIALNLAARAEAMGLVVEQAEDEIAAINMALGASYAGAPSLVSTSGGGFALMVEGVSLAGMTETPLVIVVVQRPGPATGLPTRTEQADLEFVLHAGHGEFPRAVFAPGSIEGCFHLTRAAFDLAERYQGPVFLLSDQFLSDSYRAVEPFDLRGGPTVNPAAAQDKSPAGPYFRYALTEDGVSPRLLPGLSEHLVVVDSDEHTPDGHLTEDLGVRVLMNEKRLRKFAGLQKETLAPSYLGDEAPEELLVGWGSSRGPCLEAAAALRARGRKAAVLHFSQVWPLVPAQFLARLEAAGRVTAVEGNAQGQLARLIRRETGFHIPRLVLRYDGLPLTQGYILRGLDR
ncbi:MAG: 2-oxoacid:acceptor oxidoreductase subunit alpha [Thermodesulfobacteriota bacterium]